MALFQYVPFNIIILLITMIIIVIIVIIIIQLFFVVFINVWQICYEAYFAI